MRFRIGQEVVLLVGLLVVAQFDAGSGTTFISLR